MLETCSPLLLQEALAELKGAQPAETGTPAGWQKITWRFELLMKLPIPAGARGPTHLVSCGCVFFEDRHGEIPYVIVSPERQR